MLAKFQRRLGLRIFGFVLVWLLVEASLFASDRYDVLEAGENLYRDVVVRSQSASSLVVSHAKGIAQIPLSGLSEELQRKYGYDARSDAEREAELDSIRSIQIEASKQRLDKRREEAKSLLASRGNLSASRKFAAFGVAPEISAEVDFRPEYREMGIGISKQGRRPSCAIHAVVGAIELLEGRRLGAAENLSEYYLYWATLKTLGRYDQYSDLAAGGEDADAGFQIPEVLQALRTYGVPSVAETPGFGSDPSGDVGDAPDESIVEAARKRSGIRSYAIPGRDIEILLGNIVHALNAGSPVVVGMAWPYYSSIRKTAYLQSQEPRPGYGHAVTLIGYRCPSGELEDITFIFRNSWGVKWGAGAYGYAKYEYMIKNLYNAHVIETSG